MRIYDFKLYNQESIPVPVPEEPLVYSIYIARGAAPSIVYSIARGAAPLASNLTMRNHRHLDSLLGMAASDIDKYSRYILCNIFAFTSKK